MKIQNKFYRSIRAILRPFVIFFFGMKAKGLENLPEEGPVIIAANHYSFMDPVFLAVYAKRQITFMAKAELFEKGITAWLMKKIGCVKLNRDGGDISAVRTVIAELKKDACIMLFPQGTRCRGRALLREEMKEGASFLALTSKAPVVPVGIYTKGMRGRIFKRTCLSFGEPMLFPNASEWGAKKVSVATDMIHKAISDNIEEARLMAEKK